MKKKLKLLKIIQNVKKNHLFPLPPRSGSVLVFRSNPDPDPLKQKLIRNTALVVIVQGFKPDEPLRIDYNLVPHLMQAWKNPIRVTSVSCAVMV